MKKRFIALLTCMAIVLACFNFNIQSDAAAKFNITNQIKYINVGQSFQIELSGLKASKVKWSSSNKSIASVNKKGVVKGKKKGNVIIKGKYKGITWQIKVTVYPKPKKTIVESNQKYAYLGNKVITSYGRKYLVLIFRYTNNNSEPHCFNYTIGYTAYQDGVQLESGQGENEVTMCKDGGSVRVEVSYILTSNSDVEFNLVGDTTYTRVIHIK